MADIKTMITNMGSGAKTNGSGDAPKKGTIEKTYQKKSQLEHILLRPDTYIGSVEKVNEQMWIYDTDKECMIQKEITYVPGLYKIYDEILVNAADNKQRDSKMDCIKIDINPETNTISIWNNGAGIPVAMHKDEKMFVPTMIFGHLLTSSNYNDEEEKVTGGRNGYGAKLCNIFSTKFTVETGSKEYKRTFKQIWGSNMSKASEPKIKESAEDFTKITFCPDLTKFKMDKLDDDIVGLLSRRAFDVAASTRGVKVFLNGKRLPVKNFKDYIDLYIKGKEDEMGNALKVVYENVNERWEVAVTLSDHGFQQVSFVNSIATMKGGRHVDHVTDMIVKQLIEVLKKKNKGGTSIKPFQVKSHMWIFVNCLIVNPTFDSQTKENMTLQVKSFGSKCTLSEKFITAVSKSGIVESVLSWAKFKEQRELKKMSGKKQSKLKGIPKLEDANEAGGRNGYKCTLILTEGDSAKSLAVSGLGVIGRDYYGVFPLRGKLLNVREATHKQIMENAEINNLIKIMGLVHKTKYLTQDDIKQLRYGKIMIMTDQDQDGSHIKGLLINFIHNNWPELLRLNFLEEFITPIVKATKKNEELSFYSLPEFEEWKTNTANHKTYNVKYYKGLGTSTSKEAKEYFQNMERHRIKFSYRGQQDDQNIVMAFSKKCVEQRKEWLGNYMEEVRRRKELGLCETYLYTKHTKEVSYTDFVNKELILFSNMDNVRSIPCLVDGLKPGQRKVIFTCLKRNDKREVKVAQLAGSVAEHSAYHHGEVSLCGTIVNLAQNYVGSNNINLLEPRGQFGTRLAGGKDSASPRYIFTIMSPLTRLIFNPSDDPLLAHEYDDNQKIEPVWYIPIIPMILVNGADGIGTGWMTKIPNFNPRKIVENIRRLLDSEDPIPMHPWYKNFKGTIEKCAEQKYAISGEIAITDNDKIEITELPIGTWTQAYKENVLEPMLHGSEKSKAVISDYKEYNTDTTVKFVITCLPGELENMERDGLHAAFKLQSLTSLTSMVLFDDFGAIRKYETPEEILQQFFPLRLKYYQKRKDWMEGSLDAEANLLSNKARFILEKCSGKIVVENKKRKIICEELKKMGFNPDPVKEWKERMKSEDDDVDVHDHEEEAQDSQEDDDVKPGASKKPEDIEKAFNKFADVQKYDYLLGMSMWMLTEERKNELLKQRDQKLHELSVLKKKTNADLWREDLDVFMKKLDEVEEKERLEELGIAKKTKKVQTTLKGRKVPTHQETMPSPHARRVEPIMADDIKKKVQAASRAKENKIKREAKKNKLFGDDEDEKDEFDDMVKNTKTLKDKIGTPEEIEKKAAKKGKKATGGASDGLKQSKLNFKKKVSSPKGKKGKKKEYSDMSGSEEDKALGSDEDISFNVETSPVKERTKRNVKAIKYKDFISSDDDKSESGDEVLFDNKIEESIHQEKIDLSSDSENEKPPTRFENSSEDLFDSLVGRKPSKEDTPPPAPKPVEKKAPPKIMKNSDSDEFLSEDDYVPLTKKLEKKKKEPTEKPKKKKNEVKKRKKTSTDNSEESDNDIFAEKTKKKTKKVASIDSDDDFGTSAGGKKKKKDSDSDEDFKPQPREGYGRAKKAAKYNFSDSGSGSD